MTTVRNRIIELASRQDGVSSAELFSLMAMNTVKNNLQDLRKDKAIFSVIRQNGKSSGAWYFSTAEAAAAWDAANPSQAPMTQREFKRLRAAEPKQVSESFANRLLDMLTKAGHAGVPRDVAGVGLGTKCLDSVSRAALGLERKGMIEVIRHKFRVIYFLAGMSNAERLEKWRAGIDAAIAIHTAKAAAARYKVIKAKPAKAAPVSIKSGNELSGPADMSRAEWTFGKQLTFNRIQDTPPLPADPRWPSFASIPLGATLG